MLSVRDGGAASFCPRLFFLANNIFSFSCLFLVHTRNSYFENSILNGAACSKLTTLHIKNQKFLSLDILRSPNKEDSCYFLNFFLECNIAKDILITSVLKMSEKVGNYNHPEPLIHTLVVARKMLSSMYFHLLAVQNLKIVLKNSRSKAVQYSWVVRKEGSDHLVLSVRLAVKYISARVLDYFRAGHFCKPSNSSGICSAEKF